MSILKILTVTLFAVSSPVFGEVDPDLVELSETRRVEKSEDKVIILGGVHAADQEDVAFDSRDFRKTGHIIAPRPLVDERYCIGDGCDAYVPAMDYDRRFKDVKGQKRLNSALGAVSGALIGDEIAGTPGAFFFGALGAVLGHRETTKESVEREAREYRDTWSRGVDVNYDPSIPLPNGSQLEYIGPAAIRVRLPLNKPSTGN